MSHSTDTILHPGNDRAPARRRRAEHIVGSPAIVIAACAGAEFAWDEFFKGRLANAHNRRSYAHAVRRFLDWCDHPDGQIGLVRITLGHVGDYLAGLELANPTKNLEKGGKAREIPVRHDRQEIPLAYIESAKITDGPLIRTAVRRTKKLTTTAMSGIDICRMMKPGSILAGLQVQFSSTQIHAANTAPRGRS